MILVDTSVWVDYFNGHPSAQTDALDDALGMKDVIIGDLILTEVLQGFRHDRHFRQARQLLQAFPMVTMVGPQLAIRSAEHYRALRECLKIPFWASPGCKRPAPRCPASPYHSGYGCFGRLGQGAFARALASE